jgi:predicted DNA-binding transcriptional regulator AlpA
MRWVREGQFPKPIRLSDSVIAWRVGTIEKHLAKLEAD